MNYRRLIPLLVVLCVVVLWACSQKNVRDDGFTPSPIAKSSLPKPEPEDHFVPDDLNTVFFDYDKSVLKPEAKKALLKNIAYIKKHPNTKIQVEGHCDERGTRQYNFKLGQKRAETVKSFLLANGVPEDRILTVSYGAVGEQGPKTWHRYRKAQSIIIYTDTETAKKD